MDDAELQRRLIARGYDLGSSGADGVVGPKTLAAIRNCAEVCVTEHAVAPPPPSEFTVPLDWMPACQMARIILHWTAGQHMASAVDKEHYHILIEGNGRLVRGDSSIFDNVSTGDGDYAAHTLGLNTGSIGVSMCCMVGAVENPFNPGIAPMTKQQWYAMTSVVAELCRRYSIQITPRTVLSHAEVQGTLGIAQRGKWDFTRLAFDPSVIGAKACGDRMRAEVSAKL